mmetsp:Transcript_51436/g.151653  ORF Transcript_51436/g.151653 Transcript_51436/m.151653 type:complete len:201 (-) Transcript_51436:112-714(-)
MMTAASPCLLALGSGLASFCWPVSLPSRGATGARKASRAVRRARCPGCRWRPSSKQSSLRPSTMMQRCQRCRLWPPQALPWACPSSMDRLPARMRQPAARRALNRSQATSPVVEVRTRLAMSRRVPHQAAGLKKRAPTRRHLSHPWALLGLLRLRLALPATQRRPLPQRVLSMPRWTLSPRRALAWVRAASDRPARNLFE